jgi:outer membrane protein assembly complex protein YaeT
VRAAASEITRLYISRGYLLAEVSEPQIVFRDDGKVADLAYSIDEGILFRIAELELAGEPVLPEEAVRAALPFAVGDPYAPDSDRLARAALLEFYGKAGHADATVAVTRSVDETTGEVGLRIEVSGGIRVTVSELRVEGNDHTRTSFIERRVTAPIGEPFTPEHERESFRRLFGTGIFSRIALELEGEGPERPLVVRVEEALAQEVFVEPGWGSYELARLKAGYRNRNLFGTGRSFRAEGIASFLHLEAELGVSEPFLFGSEVFADVSVTALRREEPSFTRLSTGIDASLTRRWGEDWATGVSYQFRRSAAENVDITDPAALAALDDVDISAIEISGRLDTRDSPLVPTSGHSARLAIQWGDQVLGSELDFLRTRYRQSHYFPLPGRDTVLALAVRSGVIIPTHDTIDIPIQELFFNGGENTVRSFRQDELGPLDANGQPLGGEAFTVLSAELRQKLHGNLSGALFFDWGNVAANYEDYFDFDDFRPAVGIGLRYLLPIGPLRLDAGWNPTAAPAEDDVVLHFSVGLPF